jgi:hypothetical protein
MRGGDTRPATSETPGRTRRASHLTSCPPAPLSHPLPEWFAPADFQLFNQK